MLRFIQEVNTTTRSCALWDLEEDTEYIVHVQAISIQGQSPASEPVLFKTPREAEKMASKNKDEVTMKEMGRNQQLRTGEVLIIVVVLFMWAGESGLQAFLIFGISGGCNQIPSLTKPRVKGLERSKKRVKSFLRPI
ncbi:fibronectin type III domain-containing protein 5 [Marmota marmota marmota]|nr:fibronectin type III domain-containing protein 5 [Marmota marmota marmota]